MKLTQILIVMATAFAALPAMSVQDSWKGHSVEFVNAEDQPLWQQDEIFRVLDILSQALGNRADKNELRQSRWLQLDLAFKKGDEFSVAAQAERSFTRVPARLLMTLTLPTAKSDQEIGEYVASLVTESILPPTKFPELEKAIATPPPEVQPRPSSGWQIFCEKYLGWTR